MMREEKNGMRREDLVHSFIVSNSCKVFNSNGITGSPFGIQPLMTAKAPVSPIQANLGDIIQRLTDSSNEWVNKGRNKERTELLAPGELKREMAEKQRKERRPGENRVQTGCCVIAPRVGNQNKGFFPKHPREVRAKT